MPYRRNKVKHDQRDAIESLVIEALIGADWVMQHSGADEPDLWVGGHTNKGVPFSKWLEIKSGAKAKVSEGQKAFLANHPDFVVKIESVEEAIAWWNDVRND